MARVLIVDDDAADLRQSLEAARNAGIVAIGAHDGREALAALRNGPEITLVILDLIMPELDGFGVLEIMAREGMRVAVMVQSGSFSLETVNSALRLGAMDFMPKPLTPARLAMAVRAVRRQRSLERAARAERGWRIGTLTAADLIGGGPEMDRVRALAQKAARTNLPVLVEGEAGTGKSLIARAIHGMGERAGKPFVVFQCGLHPDAQIDALLFGRAGHPGQVHAAQGGTLVLQCVDELPPNAQEKLLTLLSDGEVTLSGAAKAERLNVRVIATSRRRLLNAAKAGSIREDLFYRLNVMPIYVPPLRERRGDIEALAEDALARLQAEAGRPVAALSPQALALLESHDWTGNISQLETALFRASALCEGDSLDVADFPHIVAQSVGRGEALRAVLGTRAAAFPVSIDDAQARPRKPVAVSPAPDRFLLETGDVAPLAQMERELIAFALKRHKGHLSQVARSLGIGRSTLYRKLAEYGLGEVIGRDAA